MDKRSHRGNFLRRISVIEFQDHRIWLATVNAGVRAKVAEQLPSVLEQAGVHLRDRPSDVVRLVREVVRPTKDRMT